MDHVPWGQAAGVGTSRRSPKHSGSPNSTSSWHALLRIQLHPPPPRLPCPVQGRASLGQLGVLATEELELVGKDKPPSEDALWEVLVEELELLWEVPGEKLLWEVLLEELELLWEVPVEELLWEEHAAELLWEVLLPELPAWGQAAAAPETTASHHRPSGN